MLTVQGEGAGAGVALRDGTSTYKRRWSSPSRTKLSWGHPPTSSGLAPLRRRGQTGVNNGSHLYHNTRAVVALQGLTALPPGNNAGPLSWLKSRTTQGRGPVTTWGEGQAVSAAGCFKDSKPAGWHPPTPPPSGFSSRTAVFRRSLFCPRGLLPNFSRDSSRSPLSPFCPIPLPYWSVFLSFGLCIAFLGPTLLDLRCQTHSSLSQISWVFFSQQLCLLLGSVIGGVFKRTLAQSLWALFTSSLTISLVFAVIPFCRDVKVLAAVMALAGLAMGCIDTVANMQLVRIYQKDSAIFLQVLHFFVGFGALLSPLIADPFLSEDDCLPANGTANTTSSSHLFRASRVLGHRSWSNGTLPGLSPPDRAGTRVSYAFWIMALINLPVPMAVLFLLSKERLVTCCPQRRPLLLSADELALETQPPEKEDASSLPPKIQSHPAHEDLFSCCQRKNFKGAPCSFFAIHIIAALVLFMMDGITGVYSTFVYSYAVEKPLSVRHKVAGYLPSLFWGFITLGRLVSIPISSRMKPATMVSINVVGVVVTYLVLLTFSYNVIFLFVGTASLGLFLSSTFPSMLAYTEDALQYKGCATTVLVTGAGIGEMALQMLVGWVFQAQGSYSFLVCGVIFGCLAFAFYILLLFFHRMHPGLSSVLTQDKPLGMESSECYQR